MVRSIPALLLGLVLTAGVARADQLQILDRPDAERAVAALCPGTLFVEWISHMDDSTPVLKRVHSVEVKKWEYGQDQYKVHVKAVTLATTTRGPSQFDSVFDFRLERRARPVVEAVDLAYVYVPSTEIDGMFVNLGKKLKLPCEVDWIALEIPARVLHEVKRLGLPSTPGLSGAVRPRR
ncbi:MAG: hypothetical protein M9894_35220 [Planctomycetes bacterium]|nr:hypothetical protein [Planctomycetota bacterium]